VLPSLFFGAGGRENAAGELDPQRQLL
jgi:hypothetical protein